MLLYAIRGPKKEDTRLQKAFVISLSVVLHLTKYNKGLTETSDAMIFGLVKIL